MLIRDKRRGEFIGTRRSLLSTIRK